MDKAISQRKLGNYHRDSTVQYPWIEAAGLLCAAEAMLARTKVQTAQQYCSPTIHPEQRFADEALQEP